MATPEENLKAIEAVVKIIEGHSEVLQELTREVLALRAGAVPRPPEGRNRRTTFQEALDRAGEALLAERKEEKQND